jgi:hypothetical protein
MSPAQQAASTTEAYAEGHADRVAWETLLSGDSEYRMAIGSLRFGEICQLHAFSPNTATMAIAAKALASPNVNSANIISHISW